MENYRVDIWTVPVGDQTKLSACQKKINNWCTTGTLKKYEMIATGGYVIFNICRKKES